MLPKQLNATSCACSQLKSDNWCCSCFSQHIGCCRARAPLHSRCYPLSIAGSLMCPSFPSSSLFPRGGGQLLQLLMPNLDEKEWQPLGQMPKFWSGLPVWSKPPGCKPLWKLLTSCHGQELVTSRTKRICWFFKKQFLVMALCHF